MKERSSIGRAKDFVVNTAKKSVFPSAVGIVAFNVALQIAAHDFIKQPYLERTMEDPVVREYLLKTALYIFGSVFGINAVVDGLIKPAIKKAVVSSYSKEIAKLEEMSKK